MTEKEIVEVFVRVQEPEYYDRIMLLVGAKFAEIVKIGETIEDGLKSGKIARVAASPGSSGSLRKKREEVVAISYGGRKTPRSSSYSHDRSQPSPKSYQSCYTQSSHPNNQNATSIYRNVQAPVYQSPPLNYQSSFPIYTNHPPPYQIPSPYQGVAPNCANVQSSYQAPPPVYQVQAPLYRNPPPNYQAPSPNYQTNPYPRSQAPRPNTKNYQQGAPPQQDNYDPPRPKFEKRPSRNFTALAESRTKLYERLAAAGYIHPVGPKPDLIDQEVVSLQPGAPNVNTNPLPNHGGSNVNMIKTYEDWC
ncbi:extensin-2-like [Solanum pennellii]|uniref:Extensin-2-like n=1 Tax=Solanum pennellii TaxID=28526 RepID=A0ABM1FCM9_SOLPN|nr:extensin-2-like [Solanum pennellii]